MIQRMKVNPKGQGLFEITQEVMHVVKMSRIRLGLCTVFVPHTSCSLLIQENAEPSARRDLERWLNRLVPESDALFTHTFEGADDMPAHIKSMLTNVSLSIPIDSGQLVLGTWQGIYLWEHRHQALQRELVVYVAGN